MPRNELLQVRRSTSTEWGTANPVLALGEPGFAWDINELRVGNGMDAWLDLTPVGGEVDEQTLADAIADYLADNPITAVVPDATDSVKGALRLTGDLGGTADSPTVPGLADKAESSHTHAQSDVTGLSTALSGLAPLDHMHDQADVTGLPTALANLAPLAHTHAQSDVTGLAGALADKSDTGHTHTSSGVTDFTEAVQDAVAALLAQGTNVTLSYNDAGDTLTVSSSGGSFDAEAARDALGVALVGVGNITVTVNDALDTITISTTATVNSTDAALRDRSTHTGTQAISTVTGLQAALDAGANVGIPTYLSASEPAPAGPLLWIKDLGSNAYSLAIKTP